MIYWRFDPGKKGDLLSARLTVRRLGVVFAVTLVSGVLTGRAVAGKQVFGPNRVNNRSFESLLEGWNRRIGAINDGPVKEAVVEIDSSVAHTGVHSLKFSGDADTTKWFAVESEPIPITPGKRYKFSTWSTAKDVHREGAQYHNCNAYIQFRDDSGKIIPLGISPLRTTHASNGSHDWFESFTIVVAPEGATQARFGVTLTCSGTVWFDDVGLFESIDPAWAKRSSEGFAWFFTQGDVPTKEVMEAGDAYLHRLEQVLGVTHKEPILYYKYKSIDQKTEYTKKSGESHVEGAAIHTVKWDEHQDIVHVLMQQVGRSTLVLAEGIAAYATAVVDGRNVHADARALVKDHQVVPINNFLNKNMVTLAPRYVMEAEFGSYVGFLVERDGMDAFKKFYAYPLNVDPVAEMPSRYESVYGQTFDEGQRDWILFLQSGKKKPAPRNTDK